MRNQAWEGVYMGCEGNATTVTAGVLLGEESNGVVKVEKKVIV